jgi:hypothetical protein
MKKLVLVALAAFLLLGMSSAQNIPIEVFGGYSYYSLDLPANPGVGVATSTRLAMNGWDVSGSVGRWHHLSAEGDVSGHSVSNCNNNTSVNCSNFSYMFGPRYNLRDGSKMTFFVHGLVGQDRGTLAINGASLTDTSLAFAGGVGVDYWVSRHIGLQLGPVDYIYTRHLNDEDYPSQSNLRASAGVVFRFGGEGGSERAPKSRPAPSSGQPSSVSARQTAQPSANVPGHGMAIAALGIAVGPQEFDGAKILEVDPSGVGEMASMKVGDLIKSVDGKPVRTPMELLAELSDKSGKVKIGIQRGDFATETIILLGAH